MQTRPVEQARSRRRQRRILLDCPVEVGARPTVEGNASIRNRHHPVRRRQAALEPVLGDDDGRPPLGVQAAQQPDQLVAGDGVELRGRLVEQDHRRPRDQRRRQRDPLKLAAGERVDGAVEQLRDRQRQHHLLDRAGAGGLGLAAHLQRQLDLIADDRRDDLGLRVLADEADLGAEVGGAVLGDVEPGDLEAAAHLAAVVVRDETAEGMQQRRLPRARAAREDDQLAGLDLQVDIPQGVPSGVGIAVCEAPQPRELSHLASLR